MKECVAKRWRMSLHLIVIILVTVFIKYRFKKKLFYLHIQGCLEVRGNIAGSHEIWL
jgi:hypothetical protein